MGTCSAGFFFLWRWCTCDGQWHLDRLVINRKGARSLAQAWPPQSEVFLPLRCRSVAVGTQHNIVLLTNDSHCQTGRIIVNAGRKKPLSIFFSLSCSAAPQYSLKSFRGTSEAFVKCICTQCVIFWKMPSVLWFFPPSSQRWNVQHMNTNRHPDICRSHKHNPDDVVMHFLVYFCLRVLKVIIRWVPGTCCHLILFNALWNTYKSRFLLSSRLLHQAETALAAPAWERQPRLH